MSLRLVVKLGDRTLRFLLSSGDLVLGSSADCDLRISHPTVSRRHARLSVGDGHAVLTDLGSSN